MSQIPFDIKFRWKSCGDENTLSFAMDYTPEVIGSEAVDKFKDLWQGAFIRILKSLGEEEEFELEVLTPMPEGQEDAVLSYGGDGFTISIDGNHAALPYLERRLRVMYAQEVVEQMLKDCADTFASLTLDYVLVGHFHMIQVKKAIGQPKE